MEEAILQIIEAYKLDFERVNADERYKWEAIGHYKKIWDIKAEDFAGMVSEAFKKSENLLASGMYYPLRMVIGYAKEDPEAVRELFRVLYNEDLSFSERYETFRAGFDKYISGRWRNHYQDLRAISVYLTFEYPEKYFMYKYMMVKEFKKKIGYVESSANKPDPEKYDNYIDFCNEILEYVKQDEELLELSRSRFDESCYKDEALHILTHDIIYFGSRMERKSDMEGYWPTLDEYDPELTSEEWKRFILDIELPDHSNTLTMLKCLMDSGGEASCKQLAQKYGGPATAYVCCSVNLGKRAKKYFNLPSCMENGQERFFPIPFVGKYNIEDGKKTYIYKIRPELLEALKEVDLSDIPLRYDEETVAMSDKTDISLNTILYGPPGTGKTYHTVIYAVAIIENRPLQSVKEEKYAEVLDRYHAYQSEGLIEFTTFHQSYGYEEFIEGIKPETTDDGNVNYRIQSGIFKCFCEDAQIGGTDFETAWQQLISKAKEQGRYIFTRRTGSRIEAELRDDNAFIVHWNGGQSNVLKKENILSQWKNHTYSDRESIPQGGTRWVFDANQAVIDELINQFEMRQYPDGDTVSIQNRVFIIDEINRGNISKIFGELITLIEATKRVGEPEAVKAKLPYSGKPFGVPNNVYILGTMNTADRSIALMDTALRRRFSFVEMMPDEDVLRDQGAYVIEDGGETVDVAAMLEVINQRIAFLYDREHMIGHAFFIGLAEEPSIEKLAAIFEKSVIPLLQEYFYEDYQKIQLVLGDNAKSDPKLKFISDTKVDLRDLFKGNVEDIVDEREVQYSINKEAFLNIYSYKSIAENL